MQVASTAVLLGCLACLGLSFRAGRIWCCPYKESPPLLPHGWREEEAALGLGARPLVKMKPIH